MDARCTSTATGVIRCSWYSCCSKQVTGNRSEFNRMIFKAEISIGIQTEISIFSRCLRRRGVFYEVFIERNAHSRAMRRTNTTTSCLHPFKDTRRLSKQMFMTQVGRRIVFQRWLELIQANCERSCHRADLVSIQFVSQRPTAVPNARSITRSTSLRVYQAESGLR